MASTGNPADPMSDLRSSLDEDEPLFPSSSSSQPPPSPSAGGGPPAVPPPLPRRPSGAKTGAIPAASPKSGIIAPAQPSPGVAAATHEARTAGDPFKEPPEPRPPRSGSPEDKLEYFRSVLKLKEETLGRGRQLYAEREGEAEKLRGLSAQMKAQLDQTLKDLEEAKLELKANEDDRKDLSRALAETEAQVPALKEQLDAEKGAHGAARKELEGAKEALANAQDRVSQVAAEKSEVEGNLEAVQEQYQVVSAENDKLVPELERVKEELETITAERNAAVAERDATKGDLEAAAGKTAELEKELAEAQASVKALESESEWAKSSLDETEKRLANADKAKSELEQSSTKREAGLSQELEDEKAKLLGLEGERNELAEEVGQLKQELETVKQQARAQLDSEKKKIHESLTASFTKKLTEADARASAEEDKRADVEARLAEAEGKAQALEEHAAQTERIYQEKMNSGESASVKKIREELNQANKKAMEATAAAHKLQAQVSALEQAVARERDAAAKAQQAAEKAAHAVKDAPSGASASAEVVAERDKLKQDVANLKRKLVAAESAMEVAAGLKAKVSRLEAELKKHKK